MAFCGLLWLATSLCGGVDEKSEPTSIDDMASIDPIDIPFLSDSSITRTLYEPGVRYPLTSHSSVFPLVMPQPSREADKGRLALTVGTLASVNIYAYKKFQNIWWNYPKSPFHLYRGWRQTEGWYDFGPDDSLWFHMDKFGHFYSTRLLSLFLSDTAQWIGFEKNAAQWIGAVASWLFYLQIEIFDGQFEQWGFSLGDLAANTAGAFMPIISARSPFLQKFTLKMSYAPREIQLQQHMVEDYAGMTYWLTSNPQDFLSVLDPLWPDFLNLAFGYSITQKAHGDIELYFSLDYDLTKIKARSSFWNRVLYYANFIHLPAPTIKFKPTTHYYLFYY
jgi:hypothetical protein